MDGRCPDHAQELEGRRHRGGSEGQGLRRKVRQGDPDRARRRHRPRFLFLGAAPGRSSEHVGRQRSQAHRDDQAPAAHVQGDPAPRHRLRHPALLLAAGLLRLWPLGERRRLLVAVHQGLRAEHRPRLRRAAHVRLARQIDSLTRALVLATLLVLLAGAVASAHDERFSSSKVEIKPNEVLWTVDVGVAGLEKVVRLPAGELELTEAQLQAAKSDIAAYVLDSLKVEINGNPVEGEAGALEPVFATGTTGQKYISYARQHIRFPSTSEVKRVQISSALFFTVIRNHQSAVIISWGPIQKVYNKYGPFQLDLTAARLNPTILSTATEFILWGKI